MTLWQKLSLTALVLGVLGVPFYLGAQEHDAEQQGSGPLLRYEYTLKKSGTAVADLPLDEDQELDMLDMGGKNQLSVDFSWTKTDAAAITMTCVHSSTGLANSWTPVPECTKSGSTLTCAQRVWSWAADGEGSFLVPTIKRYIQCTFPDTTGADTNELDWAIATAGVM